MIDVQTSQDVYPAVGELIALLEEAGHQRVAVVLRHRMYEVSWTSGSELLEELKKVLEGFTALDARTIDGALVDQMRAIIRVIDADAGG